MRYSTIFVLSVFLVAIIYIGVDTFFLKSNEEIELEKYELLFDYKKKYSMLEFKNKLDIALSDKLITRSEFSDLLDSIESEKKVKQRKLILKYIHTTMEVENEQ